jgi:hypothetical protein
MTRAMVLPRRLVRLIHSAFIMLAKLVRAWMVVVRAAGAARVVVMFVLLVAQTALRYSVASSVRAR